MKCGVKKVAPATPSHRYCREDHSNEYEPIVQCDIVDRDRDRGAGPGRVVPGGEPLAPLVRFDPRASQSRIDRELAVAGTAASFRRIR